MSFRFEFNFAIARTAVACGDFFENPPPCLQLQTNKERLSAAI
jgi:hypothetical protein